MKPLLLCAVVVTLMGCGVGSPGSAPTTGASQPSILPSTTVPSSVAAGPLAALSELVSYRFEIQEEGSESVSGAYDGPGDAVSYAFDDSGFGHWEVRRVGDRTYMRGFLTPAFAGDGVDTEHWYEVENLADPLLEGEPLHRLPLRLAEDAGPEEVADGTWIVGTEALPELRENDSLPIPVPPQGLTVSVTADEEGFEYRLEGGEGGPHQAVRIWPGEVTIETPEVSGVFDVNDAWEEEATSIRPDEDGVLFDVARYGGNVDLRLSVEADGRVVQVTDTSVRATPGDFTTWRLDDEALDTLVAEIEDSGLLDHPQANLQFGDAKGEGRSIGYHGGRVLDLQGPVDAPGLTAEQRERRETFFTLFQRLSDHSWLGDHLVEPPAPYVPQAMTVRLEESSADPTVQWPYQESVSDMEASPGVVCLEGDRVAPLWDALGDGTLGLGVMTDGAGTWRMNAQPLTPGYQLYGDPCFGP